MEGARSVVRSDAQALSAAAKALREGELVGMPTETVYGLAANATDPKAVARIFEAKQRPAFDPLIVHVKDLEMANSVLASPLSGAGLKLAAAFWPGPLTLVAPKNAELIPDLTTSGLPMVAVRVPSHPLALRLIEESALPLAAPSANLFGRVSPTRPEHVAEQLGDQVAVVLDGGACTVGVESTIVTLGRNGDDADVTVLRFGGTPVEAIEKVLGRSVKARLHSSDKPESPGQLSKHYATRTPLTLFQSAAAAYAAFDFQLATALLVVSGQADAQHAANYVKVLELAPGGDLKEAAQRLFAAMRELDANDEVQAIHVVPCSQEGLGRAIIDRLTRASVKSGGNIH